MPKNFLVWAGAAGLGLGLAIHFGAAATHVAPRPTDSSTEARAEASLPEAAFMETADAYGAADSAADLPSPFHAAPGGDVVFKGPDPRTAAAVDDDPAVKDAVDRGLKWLAREQSESGAWIEDLGYKFNDMYNITGQARPHVGVTALALMAFLSGGHLPGRGPYGKVVERGTDFILSCVDQQDGYVAFEGSRMYSHAFATLYLAEILGMTHRADLKQKLQLAVNLTAASQNERGSWRYEPHSPESDMSITVCQVMALRAARNVGIKVNKKVIDNAYDYVVRSAERSGHERGGFHYQEKDRTRTSFALTAAGVATLHNTGIYEHALIGAGINYLKRQMPRIYKDYPGHYFYWYGHYYASQVFFTASDPSDPKLDLWRNFYWDTIKAQLFAQITRTQDGAAYWKNTVGPGDAFSTAVACIILQIPYQFLPIFQR